jgi:hypothetical protein
MTAIGSAKVRRDGDIVNGPEHPHGDQRDSHPGLSALEPCAMKVARTVLRGERSEQSASPTRLVTTQSTPPRTVVAKSGMILPATLDQRTDMNLITTAMTIYYKQSGCLGSFDTAILLADAMRDSSAVIVQYVALDGEMTARCLWPTSISFTKEKKIAAKCYCTLRREWKTFRLDRMLACHPLTTPDDIETTA